MALKTNDGEQLTGNQIQPDGGVHTAPQNNAQAEYASAKANMPIFGFGSGLSNGMLYTEGSAEIREVFEMVEKTYLGYPEQHRPKAVIIDKQLIDGPAFSAITVGYRFNNNKVNYYVILFEDTGRQSLTAGEITREMDTAMRSGKNAFPEVWTTDAALDKRMLEFARNELAKVFPNAEFRYTDGVVVNSHNFPSKETLVKHITAIAWRAVYNEAAIASGARKDINIASAVSSAQGSTLRINTSFETAGMVDDVFRPVRADFVTELVKRENNNQMRNSINSGSAYSQLCRAYGFVDSVPVEINVPSVSGPRKVTRFAPHIVLTGLQSMHNTLGWALLDILQASIVRDPNMWVRVLASKVGGKRTISNIGALNVLANLEDNQNGIGEALDFSAKGVTSQQVIDYVQKLHENQMPVFSMDIDNAGPQTYFTSALAVAARLDGSQASVNAARHIVATASWLTNGGFPANYPLEKIFSYAGVKIPVGTWANNHGVQDLRDIDVTFVASRTNDRDMINRMILTTLPATINGGFDPYMERIKVLSAIDSNIRITGTATRVTFHPEFIAALTNAAQAAGLMLEYIPDSFIQRPSDIGHISGYITGAGMSAQVPGFATYGGQTGGTGYMPMPWHYADVRYL